MSILDWPFNCCTGGKLDPSRFDAWEVGGIRDMASADARERGETFMCSCAGDDAEQWTIFGHLVEGGVDAVHDGDTAEEAVEIAEALAAATGKPFNR